MIVLLIALVLAAGMVLSIALAIKKKSSSGKVGVVPVAFAIIFAIALCIVPMSIHIVNTGEIAVVKHMGEAKEVKTAGMHFDLWITEQYDYYDSKVQNVEISTQAYSSDAQTMNIAMTLQYQISIAFSIEI